MAVPVIATQTTFVDGANTTSRTINKPASTASGDWLVCIISMDGSGAVTLTGSTFTTAFQLNGNTNSFAVFTREVDGTEGASFTVGSSSEMGAGVMMRITGGDSTEITDVLSVFHGHPGVNGEINAPILYSETDDALIIHACGSDSGLTALTKPSADTAIVTNLASSSAAGQLTVSSIDQASAGYTATAHFATSLVGEEHICVTIALRSTSTVSAYPDQPVVRCQSQRAPLATQAMDIKKPYGTVDDDLLIAAAVSDIASTLTPDGTFTSVQNSNNGTVCYTQLYRRIASSEGASYTWSNTTTASKMAVMLRIVNYDTATPIDNSSVATGNDSTIDASTITPSVDNCLLLFLGGADDDDVTYNSGYPTGYTNLLTLGSTQGSDSTLMFAFNTQTTAAATGTVTGNLTVGEEWVAILAAIKPDAGGGTPVVAGFMQNLDGQFTANYGGQGFYDPTIQKLN